MSPPTNGVDETGAAWASPVLLISCFADRLLSWIARNKTSFTPPNEASIVTDAPTFLDRGPARKAFGELGAALRIAKAANGLHSLPVLDDLSSWWLATLQQQRCYHDLESRLGLFSHYVGLVVVENSLSHSTNHAVVAALQTVIDRGYVDRIERTAWNQLDLRYFFECSGLRHGLPDEETLVSISSICAPPSLMYATDADLYAVTHIVFDICRYGARALPTMPGLDPDGLALYLKEALMVCMFKKNWDIMAEFLMCRVLLDRWDAVDALALDVLLRAQVEDGAIPSSQRDADRLPSLGPAERFKATYHTSIVALFLLGIMHRVDSL